MASNRGSATCTMPHQNIPMQDLPALHSRLEPSLSESIARVVASGKYIRGVEVKALESELARYVGTPYCHTCANGTEAIQIALMALGLKPGDEVITSPFSFIAAAEACKLLGLKAVFADIDPKTYNIAPRAIEALVTPRTRAVIPVHLFGRMAPMEPILDVARRHGLYVIEDAAQAFGAEQDVFGRRLKACSVGLIGCTSFFPTKNLGCMGDGGAIFTSSEELARRVAMVASHGAERKYHSTCVGLNSRLDEIQAAVLRVKLRHLDECISRRQAAALRYRAALAGCDFVSCPDMADGHTFNQFTLRVNYGCRDDMREFLALRGVDSMIYFPEPIHRQPVFAEGEDPAILASCPRADEAAASVLSLPMHSELSPEAVGAVASAVRDFNIGAVRRAKGAAS